MATRNSLPDAVRFVVFTEIQRSLVDPKAQRKAYFILEAAIACYAKRGWDKATMEMISREAGVSRSVISHYFKTGEELRVLSIKYIRLLFQRHTVKAVSDATTPLEMLKAYLHACFDWSIVSRAHAIVWLSFLVSAAIKKEDRKLNTLAVDVGWKRLTELITIGNADGSFIVADPAGIAKTIQTLVTAGMICLATEDFEDSGKSYKTNIVDHSLILLGASRV